VITVLTGENGAVRTAELGRIVAEFIAAHGDMAVERLDGEEATYERMLESVESMPFLADRKLVILRAPGSNKEFAEAFADFPSRVADSCDVVLVEPKLDKRSSYFKSLKKLSGFKEYTSLDSQGLARFAQEYATNNGGTISSSTARMLVERLAGTDQLLLQNELDKLLSYNLHITNESVGLLIDRQPQSTVFELLEAAFSGNTARVVSLYAEQRALKVEPQQIVAMLAWQLHILALVKAAKDRSPDTIAREAKVHPFVVKKSQALVRRMSRNELIGHLRDLRAFDVRMKSEGIVADEAVQYYLLKLGA